MAEDEETKDEKKKKIVFSFKSVSVADPKTGEEIAGFDSIDASLPEHTEEDEEYSLPVRCRTCRTLVCVGDIGAHLDWHAKFEEELMARIPLRLGQIVDQLDGHA